MKDDYLLGCIQEYKNRLMYSTDRREGMKEKKQKVQLFKMYKDFIVYGKKYERRWRRLCNRYKKIRIIGIEFVSIGETIPRLFTAIKDLREESPKTLFVVLPVFFQHYSGGIYNKRIFDLLGRHLYFIRESNISFWLYVAAKHAETLDKSWFHHYDARRAERVKVKKGKALVPFTKEQTEEGEARMKQMGITGEFICLHARENRVKELEWVEEMAKETSCRDCDINSYGKACLYMEDLGYQAVRMGKYEIKQCKIPGVIDYANDYYDELMDFYLLSKSKFLLGSNSGLPAVAGFWGCPVLITNVVNLCYGLEAWPDTGLDMYLPKKYWSEKEKRYLNLYEILEISNDCDIYNSKFRRRQIVLKDNTQEEILEAVKEMNAKVDGRWTVSEEEDKDRRKYWQIMDAWNRKHSYVLPRRRCKGYTMVFWQISYSYLKNNRYLLDVDSSLLE